MPGKRRTPMDSQPTTAAAEPRPPRPLGPDVYLSRELSTLAFNQRVLAEASDPRQPLLERVKFAAVFGSNLDEFFTLRIGDLREGRRAGATTRGLDGMTPAEELTAIRATLLPLLAEHQRVLADELMPQLAAHGLALVDYRALSRAQQDAMRQYFAREVFPLCTPLGFDPGHPFPLLAQLSVNLAVELDDPQHGRRIAIVKVPDVLPRLVRVPGDGDGVATFVWQEQVVAAHLDRLFNGIPVVASYPFRVLRRADLEVQTPDAGDLIAIVEAGVSQRRFSTVEALLIDASMSDAVRALLMEHLELTAEDVWVSAGPLGLGDLMELYAVGPDQLKDAAFVPHVPAVLQHSADMFAAIRQGDILLQHPYDSYAPVVDFIRAGAEDPDVLAVKQTLYRVGHHSAIVSALEEAARRGKEVAVLMELTAQGDEETNVEWTRGLEQAGVHATYGVLGLKTHGKATLVVRRDADGLRSYVHIGSGNYNPGTATRRTDLSLLTCDPELAADVCDLFNHITGYSRQTVYRKLLVAPVSLRQGMVERIDREIAHQARSGNGRLIFKMNALVDPGIVESLCWAAAAGVRIDIIVRGICCLRPGVPGRTEGVHVMSVVGRFLEHGRAYYFHNGGEPEVLFGSADLMPRNLDKRIEVLAPITSEALKARVLAILETYLRDNLQAWDLLPDGTWKRRQPAPDEPPLEAQAALLAEGALGAPGN